MTNKNVENMTEEERKEQEIVTLIAISLVAKKLAQNLSKETKGK